jgi:hypothetical protein
MYKSFDGNINHKVSNFSFQGNEVVRKIYDEKSDEIIKFEREFNFYNYCVINKITCVPDLLAKEKNSLILEYINGVNFENVNPQNLFFFTNFLKTLNLPNNSGMMNLPIAGEAILVSSDLVSNIKKRFQQVGFEGEYHPDNLQTYALEILKEGEKTYHEIGKVIVNPSDFGVHNSLLSKNQLVFFDFEYSGLDSLLKCVMDFVLHPANKIDISEIDNVAKTFSAAVGLTNFAILESTKKCFYLWWILRLLNSISKTALKEKLDNNLIKEKDLKDFIQGRLRKINNFNNFIHGTKIKS